MGLIKQKFYFGLFFSLLFSRFFSLSFSAIFLMQSFWTTLEASPSAWVEGKTKASKVRLVSALSSLSPKTEDILLGLEFQLEPGWHVYWKNAGDVGYAPKLRWTLPPDWRSSDLLYPAPKEFLGSEKLNLISWGYEDQVIYLNFLSRSSDSPLSEKEFLIQLKLDYLVCAEQCIP